jgi:hypothetical protein
MEMEWKLAHEVDDIGLIECGSIRERTRNVMFRMEKDGARYYGRLSKSKSGYIIFMKDGSLAFFSENDYLGWLEFCRQTSYEIPPKQYVYDFMVLPSQGPDYTPPTAEELEALDRATSSLMRHAAELAQDDPELMLNILVCVVLSARASWSEWRLSQKIAMQIIATSPSLPNLIALMESEE